MKSLFLIKHNDKEGSVYLYLNVKNKLENFGDLIKDSITEKKLYTIPGNENEMSKLFSNKDVTKVNFSSFSAKGSPKIESPMTKECLKKNSLTCVALCYNLAGEKQGIICSDSQGNLYKCSIDYVSNLLKQKASMINNLFLRNGKELVLTKGNYNAQGSLVPIIEIGTRLSKPKEEIKEDLKESKAQIKRYNIKELSKLREPIKSMTMCGYKPYVDMFKLNNPAYPESTLWFYKDLFDVGEFKIVGNMLTTKPFNSEQLSEIYLGLKSGVDVTRYADVSVDEDGMEKARKKLEQGTFTAVIPKRLVELQNEYIKGHFQDVNKGKQIEAVLKKIKASEKKGNK